VIEPDDSEAATAAGIGDFDRHAVLAKLRAGDEAAMAQAYRETFAGQVGRLVLADILMNAGVGRRFGGALRGEELAYHQGGHDVALEIMDRAGFDPASAALMTITGLLEGRDDERSSFGDERGHEPELGD
jgi:hypothetical protein